MRIYNVGVVGLGYWGPNLCRNFAEHPRFNLVAVADMDEGRLLSVSHRLLSAVPVNTLGAMLGMPVLPDLVAIATPLSTHYELARQALEAGCHVLVEKPLAATYDEAVQLVELAERRERMLAVDHTFLFSGPVLRLWMELPALGELRYVSGVRTNLGLYQPDCDVVWDLAPHDLAILQHLTGQRPEVVSAQLHRLLPGARFADAASATLRYGETVVELSWSWISPVKQRRMCFVGSKRMAVWDDNENVEKLRVYDCGAEVSSAEDSHRARVQYRRGDMVAPRLQAAEALRTEVDHLVTALDNGLLHPRSDGRLGADVVRTIEEIRAKAGGS